jgi:hypothetical protein
MTRNTDITAPARLLAVEVLLAEPELLGNDPLEVDLYVLRDDLRARVQAPDFRDTRWNERRDEALLNRADLAESLSQMNTGNTRPALTLDEEREERANRP